MNFLKGYKKWYGVLKHNILLASWIPEIISVHLFQAKVGDLRSFDNGRTIFRDQTEHLLRPPILARGVLLSTSYLGSGKLLSQRLDVFQVPVVLLLNSSYLFGRETRFVCWHRFAELIAHILHIVYHLVYASLQCVLEEKHLVR